MVFKKQATAGLLPRNTWKLFYAISRPAGFLLSPAYRAWTFVSPMELALRSFRANVIAQALEKKWGVTALLGDLSPTPIWSINCCAGEKADVFASRTTLLGTTNSVTPALKTSNLPKRWPYRQLSWWHRPFGDKTSKFSWAKRPSWGAHTPQPPSLRFTAYTFTMVASMTLRA